jgi:ABC-2 type transport system permease protein
MEDKNFNNNLKWIGALIKRNKNVVLEYKKSLLIETFGMLINNMAFIFVWYVVFKKFGEIRGWNFEDLFLLNAFVAFMYALVNIFMKGSSEISTKVSEGQLDQYMTQPKNVLVNLLFSEVTASALGDLLESLVSLSIYFVISATPVISLLMFLPLAFLSTFVYLGFLIATQSIVFWLPNSEELSSTFLNITLGTALYPNKAFSKIPRIFFTVVLPATLLGTVPADILINPNLEQFSVLLLLAIFWMFFGVFLFKKGIKRYESGNVFGGT